MIRNLLIAILVCTTTALSAQQVPQYTQYQLNHFGINPALAGIKECVDMRLGYRRQWLGFEDAPVTAFANVNGRLPNKRNPLFKGIHGVGAMVESDATGPTSRTTLLLAYAYHMRIRGKTWISFGVYAGFQQYRFNINEITLPNYADPAVTGSASVLLVPDISPGVWVYHDDWYAGAVLRQAVRRPLDPIGFESKITHHYMVEGGRRWKNRDGVSYIPSVLLKFAPMSTPAIDLNFLVDFHNRFQLGASYRNTDAIAGLFKVNFARYFTLGYSFDFTTSKIRVASSNTHEIMLGIYSCPRKISPYHPCPAYN